MDDTVYPLSAEELKSLAAHHIHEARDLISIDRVISAGAPALRRNLNDAATALFRARQLLLCVDDPDVGIGTPP